MAAKLTDNDTHEACGGVAHVCIGVLLGGREGEVVTCLEVGGPVFLFNPNRSLGYEEHFRPALRIRLGVVAVAWFQGPGPQLGILGGGNGCQQHRDATLLVSSPCNFADVCMLRGRCCDEIDEGDAQRVSEMIETCQADIRLTSLELDDGASTDAGAISQGDLAELCRRAKPPYVRTDVVQDPGCSLILHVHYFAP